MPAAFPPPQTSPRCETATVRRWPAARKVAALRPTDAGSRKPGRAKILPRAGRVREYHPTKSECFPAVLRRFAPRQAFPPPRAIRLRADCSSTTSVTARVLLPAPLLQSVRWLRKFRWKRLPWRIVQASSSDTPVLCVVCGSCVLQ